MSIKHFYYSYYHAFKPSSAFQLSGRTGLTYPSLLGNKEGFPHDYYYSNHVLDSEILRNNPFYPGPIKQSVFSSFFIWKDPGNNDNIVGNHLHLAELSQSGLSATWWILMKWLMTFISCSNPGYPRSPDRCSRKVSQNVPFYVLGVKWPAHSLIGIMNLQAISILPVFLFPSFTPADHRYCIG